MSLFPTLRETHEAAAAGNVRAQADRPAIEAQVPEKLYGRDCDISTLVDCLEHISRGHGEIVLVPGASGVGKTALVTELEVPTRSRNGIFIRGKFDQYNRNLPYSAFRQALGELCRELLRADPQERQRFRDDILQAVGDRGQLLVDLVPEFELLLGRQPHLADISPQEARHRFAQVFRDFLMVICRPEHPLVLFVDDWQWADAASFELLKQIEVGTTLQYLLVIASYRDDDVSASHELTTTMNDLRGRAALVEVLHLGNLTPEYVRDFVASALTSNTESVAELAAVVYERTSGNPFFVSSFVDVLKDLGLVWWDQSRTCWLWNIDAIESADLPDDIVGLFALKLRKLDSEDQHLLSLAACLGNRFHAGTLSIISGRPTPECLPVLDLGLAGGLLVPWSEGDSAPSGSSPVRDRSFAFRHDRLQQAAYSLIDPVELPGTLLRIGRLLLDNLRPEEVTERLFEIVQNLNAGESRIHDTAEQLRVIELNVRAARTAYAATAYASALHFYRAADRFLTRPGVSERLWRDSHELLMSLFRGRAECEFLEGHVAEGEKCIQLAVANARTPLEEAESLRGLIVQYTLRARYPDAIATGRRALAALGVTLPADEFDQACRDEIAEVRRLLAGRPAAQLVDLPIMTDPKMLMVAKVLITMGPPCYRSHQRLWSVIVPKVVAMTLRHGNIAQIGYSHTAFGGLLGWVDGDYATAKEFAELATRLMTDTFREPSDQSVFYLMIGSSIRHWFSHLTYGSQDYRDAYEIGLRSNNLQYAAYAFGHDMYCHFYQGAPLEQLVRESEHSLVFSRTRHNQWAIDLLEGGLSVFHAMAGTAAPGGSGKADPEAKYLRRLEEHQNIQVLCIYKILVAFSLLVAGDFDGALALSDEAEPLLYTVGTQGLLPWPEHVFARSLILASLYPTADAGRQTAWRANLAGMLHDLRVWADNCPENFEHKYLLVAAELARIEGRGGEAAPLYDQAVAAARAGDFLQWEGVANERAYEFWREQGADRLAQGYWQQAYVCYERWGAGTKVRAMEAEYRAYLVRNLEGGAVGGGLGQLLKSELVERQIHQLREHAGQTQLVHRQRETATHVEALDQAMHRLRVESAERKKSEKPVRHMALHDALTKLANRRLLDEALAETLASGGRTALHGALMFLDLDNFKPLNDSLGHDVGDTLLIEVARRLKHCVREIDTVARIGGDEFVVMIGDLGGDRSAATDRAAVIAEKIRSALAKPYQFTVRREDRTETREHRCSVSIGVVMFAVPGSARPEEILRQADGAMYRAKAGGGNKVHLVPTAAG
jgi:diguanylate cyclase (GGDEF)-like protein